MSRFFVPKECVKGNSIRIDGKEAHHILNVMRLKLSDEVVVFDGTGKEYTGIVRKAAPKSLEVEIIRTLKPPHEEGPVITLIQAIPKKEKMDHICEKATELGVHSIIPVTTIRTVPEWGEAKSAAVVERWKRIVREAAKQCGRTDIPQILPITDFRDCFASLAMTHDLKLIAALSGKAVSLKDALKDCSGGRIAIAIGPEGDFTPEEIGAAVKESFLVVSLGKRVLKSDTAGLAALAMINYRFS